MEGRLDDDLAAALEPKLQDTLNHPTRRDVLRVLHGSGRPCGATALLGKLPPLRRAEIEYHLRVLEDGGIIFADGTLPASGGGERLYRSAVEEDPQARSTLRATERGDRRLRREREGGSPGLLTMFRVPRPERAIRLGTRGRKTDRDG
ncbi:MAG TPA: helix-turn-helix domain-containing protein [Solirubrobacterales bacterium]|nr:helix-turn-helix domain-containing protein [Solirubrobacterales bacterium]